MEWPGEIPPSQVKPFASLATLSHYDVQHVLANREIVGPFKYHLKRPTDLAMTGDLVDCVWELANTAGWSDQLKSLMEMDTRREGGDQTNGVCSDTIPEGDKSNRDGCVVSERELCSVLSDLTVNERVKENAGVE